MSIVEYFKERILFILIHLIFYLIMSSIIFLAGYNYTIIFLVYILWFVPLYIYMLVEYIKINNYLKYIKVSLDKLDKKYLLPELIEEAHFSEAKIINNVLKEISRNMHENINCYKRKQNDYREYIEAWVHEIKTPIASTKLIIENNKNNITDKINIQINRIESYIEQVLYYSRSDNVNKDYIIKEVPLINIVNSVIRKNFRDCREKNIKIKIEEFNYKVYTDIKWLEFIVNQIVVNSIKYSKKSDAYISITALNLENSVILEIDDNGVGINERDVSSVFNKGFTGENGRKFAKSTGMGLYLCKKLCEKLGIGITLKSDIDSGTSVKLIFPRLDDLK